MINEYVKEIKQALKYKCYYPAFALALTLPDMCGAVEYPKSAVAERYIKWYDKYVIGAYYCKNEKVEATNKTKHDGWSS
ncbi:MAG: hypothetical protein K6B44_00720 [Lachnospiraceae bacterium]|nr:hypothetical protein [Lachnospiraceae bacterium]